MVRICKKYGLSYDDQYSFLNYVIAICGEDQFDLKTYTDNSLRLDLASRDFTMNALAYDLEAQEILDYMGGIEDIRRGIIRTSNLESFAEKPGNILRALRFSLDSISGSKRKPIRPCRKMSAPSNISGVPR